MCPSEATDMFTRGLFTPTQHNEKTTESFGLVLNRQHLHHTYIINAHFVLAMI